MLQNEIDYVENTILKIPKRDWQYDDFEKVSEWFYACGLYKSCVKLLLRGSFLITKRWKLIPVKKVPESIAEELVQEAIARFICGEFDFDPSARLFQSSFITGLKYIAVTSQRKGSKFKIEDEYFNVIYEYIDTFREDDISVLQELESKGELIDSSYLQVISQLEIKDLVEQVLENSDLENENIQAFLLKYLEEKEISEIAKYFNITENNTSVRINRGRNLLLKAAKEAVMSEKQGFKKPQGGQK